MQRTPASRIYKDSIDKKFQSRLSRQERAQSIRIRETTIDFSLLNLPKDIEIALSETFKTHCSALSKDTTITYWRNLRVFSKFLETDGKVRRVEDLNGEMLRRYIRWLNRQTSMDGREWTKQSRAAYYTTVKSLLKTALLTRQFVLHDIDFPNNPFPWRNRDTPARKRLSADHLKQILDACTKEISDIRRRRESFKKNISENHQQGSIQWLISQTIKKYNGIIPERKTLQKVKDREYLKALESNGGLKEIEPLIYPRSETLLPYYLSILVQTAGNPASISRLETTCLQELPLIDNRVAIIWRKGRASSIQRVIFSDEAPNKPPQLVKELLSWGADLRAKSPEPLKEMLFIFKGPREISYLSDRTASQILNDFCKRHCIERFSLSEVRGGVLASIYQSTGSLQRAKELANHKSSATTIKYVNSDETKIRNREVISDIQKSFLKNIKPKRGKQVSPSLPPHGVSTKSVSLFGFNCKDPYEGAAPGTKKGEICSNFLGCFICPNAIIPNDAKSIARLIQAKQHLTQSAEYIHPSRWQILYAPILRILEEDILPNFSSHQTSEAEKIVKDLPPLPELR
ncbi:phage integrase SAM-like domain-containing protein [Pseudomonas sp. CAN2814]|uniref:phage integrase SAM-like domain-containing protein n=1 Tax=Pseudomonas sp. CAN1 TaxID=3046726 RepID=UPI002649B2B2|nr:phage integrase SAM-like domain-containing protein [Pseudomonas sp. CAN1]MDN6856644.1 phage integrase SAM-like domain-containing protein [Pseudomonas sp. CAN1]